MRIISSDRVYAPIGPYTQGMAVGNLLFTAGLGGLNRVTGKVVGEDIVDQTAQAFQNIQAVLEQGGMTWLNVVKVTLFLQDIGDFDSVNKVYARLAGEHQPPRTCVAVSAMPAGERVKMEIIAYREK